MDFTAEGRKSDPVSAVKGVYGYIRMYWRCVALV